MRESRELYQQAKEPIFAYLNEYSGLDSRFCILRPNIAQMVATFSVESQPQTNRLLWKTLENKICQDFGVFSLSEVYAAVKKSQKLS